MGGGGGGAGAGGKGLCCAMRGRGPEADLAMGGPASGLLLPTLGSCTAQPALQACAARKQVCCTSALHCLWHTLAPLPLPGPLQEGHNCERFQALYGSMPRVRTPKIYWDFTARRCACAAPGSGRSEWAVCGGGPGSAARGRGERALSTCLRFVVAWPGGKQDGQVPSQLPCCLPRRQAARLTPWHAPPPAMRSRFALKGADHGVDRGREAHKQGA